MEAPTRARPEREVIWAQGVVVTLLSRSADTGGASSILDATYEPGFGPPLHVHHREDETYYVLEGEIRFRCGDDDFTAGAGELVHLPREVPHAFRTGAGGARALVITVPAGLEEMFRLMGVPGREGAEPPADLQFNPEDHRSTLEAMAKQYDFEIVGPRLS